MKKIIVGLILLLLPLHKSYCQSTESKLTHNAILIRLQTNIHLINYLIKEGQLKQAEKERLKQKRKNDEIIENFIKEWTLSPVYFFHSQYSNDIKQKNYKYLFKDKDKKPLNKEEINNLNSNYIIAFFGKTNNKIKSHALNFNNHQFNQLQKPLPRYVRSYQHLWFLKRNYKRIIQIMVRKFDFYYSRIQ